MRIDLHVHSQESDGLLPVKDVIELAYKQGVKILALTDHETTHGVPKAQQAAEVHEIKIIPGVELVTAYKGREVHLLGYFKTIENEKLQKRLKELREQRTALAFDMVKCLQRDGFTLKWSDVELEASPEGAVSKGHIMRVLYYNDPCRGQISWREIANFFQPGGIAYLPFLGHPFEDAVDLIYDTGGVPVLAHPGLLQEPNMVKELLGYRPIGLEVYYGYWEKRDFLIEYYAKISEKLAIFTTGGSDYHGPYSLVQLGQVAVPYSCAEELFNYLGL